MNDKYSFYSGLVCQVNGFATGRLMRSGKHQTLFHEGNSMPTITARTTRKPAITITSAAIAAAAVMLAAPANVSASSLNAGLSAKPAHVSAHPALTRVAGYKRERKYFGDYMTTCRPDGACDTITFTEIPTSNGQKFSSSLTFKRQRGADAPWFLTFSGVFLGPMEGTPMQVTIGSQSWTLQAGSGYGQFMAFNYFAPPPECDDRGRNGRGLHDGDHPDEEGRLTADGELFAARADSCDEMDRRQAGPHRYDAGHWRAYDA